jgi:DNA-binding transcriptional regulator YiaG
MVKKYIEIPCNECGTPKKIINGQWLKQVREDSGMNQREFGALTKTSSPYISDIERNRRSCPDDILFHYLELNNRV